MRNTPSRTGVKTLFAAACVVGIALAEEQSILTGAEVSTVSSIDTFFQPGGDTDSECFLFEPKYLIDGLFMT